MRRIEPRSLELVIGVLAILVCVTAARADLPVPFILRADADLEQLQFTIWGTNFGTATPKVRLAGVQLPVLTYSATESLSIN